MQPVRLKIKHNVALLLSVSFLPCFLAYGITPQTPKEDETAVVAEADAKEVAETGADTEAAKRKAQLSGMFGRTARSIRCRQGRTETARIPVLPAKEGQRDRL